MNARLRFGEEGGCCNGKGVEAINFKGFQELKIRPGTVKNRAFLEDTAVTSHFQLF